MKDFMHMSEPIRRAYEIAKKAHAARSTRPARTTFTTP